MLIPIRDENPTRRFPVITVALLIANVAVFLYMIQLPNAAALNDFVGQYAMYPQAVITGMPVTANSVEPVLLTILTSMFLHGGWLHIIFNMLFLWIFGNNVEDALGRVKFIVFYAATGAAGAFAHILTDPSSTIPTLGASGAISGVLAGYLVLFPNARVLTVIPIFFFIEIIRLPAIVLIGFWFLLQLLSGIFELGLGTNGGVAYFAHIGGFVAGIVLVLLLTKRRRRHSYER